MTIWADRIASRAGQPAQPDTSLYTLAATHAEIDPTEQDSSPYAVLARREAQRGLPVTPVPAGVAPKVIGPAWTPPPGWVHSGDGWNPPGTPEGVRTPMPAGHETYRRDGTSTNTPYVANTTSQAYNNAQTALGGTAATPPSGLMTKTPGSTGSSYWDNRIATRPRLNGQPDNSLFTLANQQRNSPVTQTATNFTGNEAYGAGTGPGGSYTFDDQARDRYGAANTNEWTTNMANAPPDLGAPSPWANPQAAQEEIDRRLALRGLPPQTRGATGPSGTSGTAPGLMSGQNTVASVDGKVGYEARQLGGPTKWNVDDSQTVAGQVQKLIKGNNEIQQMETTRAKQQMNENGTLNSAMGLQAVEAARYAAAMPIATADAATYGRAAAYNADTENQFAGKNVDASNTAYNATANIRANTARDTAQTIAQANLADKQGNINAAAASNLAGVNTATAAKLAQTNTAAAVLKAQNDISVAARGAINDQSLATLNGNINKARLGQDQTLQMLREMTQEMNGIQASDKFDADAKSEKINELYERTNRNLRLFERASGLTEGLLKFDKVQPPPAPTTNTDGSPIGKNPDGSLEQRVAGANGNPAATQSNFDSAAYYAANPDIATYYAGQPGGATPAQAWAHYNAAGRNEGRKAFLKNSGSSSSPQPTGTTKTGWAGN